MRYTERIFNCPARWVRRQSVSFAFLPFLFLLCSVLSVESSKGLTKSNKVSRQSQYSGKGDTITHSETVLPEKDGTLHLSAEMGKAIGPEIKYMPEWKAFGWFTAADRVEWNVEVSQSDEYEVYLEWSVSDEEAGKSFVFKAGDQLLTGTVAPSGSWEEFKKSKIGHIRLRSGRHKIVFKPNSTFAKGALLDLREIKLVPVK